MEGKCYRLSVSKHLLGIFLIFLPLVFSNTSTVTYLPGFPDPLPFHLETGYVGVDESGDVQLFYSFLRSEGIPENDPLLLWTSGGPGCSSFVGFFQGIGPLRFNVTDYNGSLPTLVLNPNSWTQIVNVLFLDSPVGAGFSYSKSTEDPRLDDTKACHQAYQFLRKWLVDHPEFLSNQIYIGGDSYAGKTTPIIVQNILDGNEAGNKPFINLKGYVIGNPVTNSSWDNKDLIYVHRMGLISDEIYESIQKNCGGVYKNVNRSNVQCLKDLLPLYKCLDGINMDHILKPLCNIESTIPEETVKYSRFLAENLNELSSSKAFGCKNYEILVPNRWVNDHTVQKALHIREGMVPIWQKCHQLLQYEKDVLSSYKYHVNLSIRGIHSLVYSGDHDFMVPFLGTQAWIQSLNYSIVDDWRPWFVDGQIGGYTRTFSNNMTFATVKGGGHVAALDRPRECYAMFKRWISNDPL